MRSTRRAQPVGAPPPPPPPHRGGGNHFFAASGERGDRGRQPFAPFAGDTDIFITPGYRFRAVDALMTNFHLPKSTLMMLVSAFSGLDTMRRAYHHAVDTGYRFLQFRRFRACCFRDAARQDGMKDDVDG